jgi:uncharacterized membrane protein YgcG
MRYLSIFLTCGWVCAQVTNCNDKIVSSAPIGDELPKSVSALVNSGADVRVRIFERFSETDSTLDAFERRTEKACSSWMDSIQAGRKNNLIVVMVAIKDRKSGLYYGAQFDSAIGTQWPRINSTIMNPRLRDGNYAGGAAAALDEVRTLITTRQATGAPVIVNQPSQPTDLSGLWYVMGSIVGILALGLLGVGMRRWSTEKRKEREDRLGARQGAAIAQQEASALVSMVSEDSFYKSLSSDSKSKVDATVLGYSQLGMGASDPMLSDLSTAQILEIQKRYERVSEELRRALKPPEAASHLASNIEDLRGYEAAKKSPNPDFKYSSAVPHPKKSKHSFHPEADTVESANYAPAIEYIDRSPAFIPIPIVVPEERVYPTVPITTKASSSSFLGDDSGSSSRPSSDSSPSGGGSSDLGASSSSDSGGSSDIGSSDLGGGGSSDF